MAAEPAARRDRAGQGLGTDGKQMSIMTNECHRHQWQQPEQWTIPAVLDVSGQNSKALVVTAPSVVANTDYTFGQKVMSPARTMSGWIKG